MTHTMFSKTIITGLLLLGGFFLQGADERREKVLSDRPTVETAGNWIYNDLPTALERGKQSGKPLLIVLRCIP